ncbi:2755_t:CDS:2 [Paraglomus occultum]|uniref:2755_t:CDS:1 n=1 Tax=Paraglomus occultum TaxID=144539 RepID=A0A9N9BRN8_9GLOM|nr:2755_t:CDS:2 [Paraglomus occultum]
MSKYRAIVDEEAILPSNSSQSNSLSIEPSTPLLSDANADEVQVEIEDEPGTASSASCVINLANTILGTGMLAMPAAVASIGVIFGSLMIIYAGTASALGLYFLSRAAAKTEGRHSSFFAVSKLTYPWAAVYFDMAIAIKCFGVGTSYLIIIGELMPEVIAASFGSSDGEYNLFLDRRFWITVFTLIVIPLAFMKKLDSLRYTSLLALTTVVYLIVIVIYNYFGPDFKAPPSDKIHYVRFSSKFFTYLPIFVFAFTCHQNVFTIYNEVGDNSQANINKIVFGTIGFSASVYEIIGILGYLTFGDDVSANIISMCRVGFICCVLLSLPLQWHPCRACLDKIISALTTNNTNGDYKLLTTNKPSDLKFFLMTSGIMISTYLLAILVSQLDLVLSFVGSTGSTTISFILPGIFYYKLHQDEPWDKEKVTAVCLASYGCVVMVVCLTMNILRVSAGH